MIRVRSLWQRVCREWPRWAQVVGLLLGFEQVAAWAFLHREANLGVMSFAAALLMFRRAVSAQQSRRENRDDDEP